METPPIRLFGARSRVPIFQGREKVDFIWFMCNRREPVAPYAELIEGYAELTAPDRRQQLEGYIDEFFTAEEIEALADYVRQAHDLELTVKEKRLPLSLEKQNVLPLVHRTMNTGQDFYMLCKEEGYDLPFDVWGLYDIRHCGYIIAQQKTERLNGVAFVRHALRALGVEMELTADQIDEVVLHLYEDHGLRVIKDEPHDLAGPGHHPHVMTA